MSTNAADIQSAKKIAAGDRAAFEVLYRKHNSGLVKLAMSISGSRALGEEIAQETWMAVLTGAGAFEGRSSLASWIFAILINKARTQARRNGRTISFDDDGDENSLAAAFDGAGRWKDLPALWTEITPEQEATDKARLAVVSAAIERLPPAQKSVLLLRVQEGLTAPEVAAALGIGEGNVRILLHRARLYLRSALD